MQPVQDTRGISLDPQGDTPIYLQVIEQIENGVASGRLRPGQQLPPVRELASLLGVNPGTVARAYSELERAGVIVTQRGAGSRIRAEADSARLSARREGRLWSIVSKAAVEALSLGYTPEEIEAAFVLHMARRRQDRDSGTPGDTLASVAETENTIVLTGSHDLTLDLLASHIRRIHPEITLSITSVGSLGGLIALERQEAHIAGSHLLDEETGEYNIPFVRRLLPGQQVVLITLAHRFQGLIVARDNPKGIVGLEDLQRREIRFINRQRGSGTRVLLDFKLRQLGISPDTIEGYEQEVDTHIATAAAVANGAADVGLGIYGAARSLQLGFVPLVRERYDLVVPMQIYESRLLKSLMEVVSDIEFKKVVDALGGYDTTDSGKITVIS